MHLEIYKDRSGSTQPWRWRLISGSRKVSSGESHRTSTDAARAGMGVVKSVHKETAKRLGNKMFLPEFTKKARPDHVIIIKWS